MLKVVLFLLGGAAFIALAWFVAGIPGQVAGSIGPISFQASTPIAILVLVVIVALGVILLGLLRRLITLPRSGAAWRRRYRRARGENAVTRVLVALAAGEPGTARTEAGRARRLLGDKPQTLLLFAEAARLAGKEDEAEEAFRTMAKQRDARFLGLRGLLRQAVDRRDWAQARAIARQTEAARPGTLWLRQQRAELALQTQNWGEALDLIGPDKNQPLYYVAAANEETDPARSLALSRRAWKQNPSFAPAALAYATRLRAKGYEMRAQSCVADAWKHAPNPDLAAFALASQSDGMARALIAHRLAARNPTNPESRFLLARAALDADMITEARHQLELARAEGLHQRRFCLLLAELEEQTRGGTEEGRRAQRDALREAASAEPDPSWRCTSCHSNHASWHPNCSICDRIGTIVWSGNLPPSGQPPSGQTPSGPPPSSLPSSGVPPSGVPTSGVPTSGVPTSGVPTSGVPTSGVPTSGVPTSGVTVIAA
jgi:HemY protein